MQITKEFSDYQIQKSISARDILHQVFRRKKSHKGNEDLAELRRINKLRVNILSLFGDLCRPLGLSINEPETRHWYSTDNFQVWRTEMTEQWIDQVLAQLKYDAIGTYHFIGEKEIVYTFFEDEEEAEHSEVRRKFRVSKKRVKHTHTVVDADVRMLPCDSIPLNAKAKCMIDRILEEKNLAKYFSMVTGVLVETEEEITKRWETETELKKALDVIRKQVGYTVEESEKDLETERRNLDKQESIRKFMRKADPAICFGNDIVFYGWV